VREGDVAKLTMIVIVLCLASIPPSAQSAAPQSESAKEFVERFCKMDAEGGQLNPKNPKEVAAFYVAYEPYTPWVYVIRNYVVGDPRVVGDARVDPDHLKRVDVKVDYFSWGFFDSGLRFTLEKGPASGEPIKESVNAHLILSSDKYTGVGFDEGLWKGPLRWRRYDYPSSYVSMAPAIRYVTEMRGKSNDPLVQYDADRTLAILKSILAGTPVPSQPTGAPQEPAEQVLQRFCKLETAGEGLTPNGRRELASFFVETPTKPQWDKILVVKDYHFSPAGREEDEAGFGMYYEPVGLLDSSLRLTEEGLDEIPDLGCCSQEFIYTLRLLDRYWETTPDGKAVKEFSGPLAWRISYYPVTAWITVGTAIRYVTEMREKSSDPVIKKNADETLAELLDLH
jgi:hypothetical protein